MSKTTEAVALLRGDALNPRSIRPEALTGLGVAMEVFGDLSGIVWNETTGELVAGHQRMDRLGAAGATTWTRTSETSGYIEHPKTGERFAIRIVRWDIETQRAANLVANNPEIQGEYTDAALDQLAAMEAREDFEALRLEALEETLRDDLDTPAPAPPGEDETPDVPAVPVTKPGDLWLLGPHRLLCGDTTDTESVRRLVGDAIATLIHADRPYGMGKEADGVANDNLYEEKLDAFQMRWWQAWLPVLSDVGSAYIWGNAPDLWRLWWRSLGSQPDLVMRNEIVWDKGSGFGMRSEGGHSYPPATERCLFFMRGQQFLGNQNIADFWEGYEPLRAWLEAERNRAGMTNGDVNRLTGTHMAGHWFSRSQFMPISEEHYATIRAAAGGRAFVETYDELFAKLFPDARVGGNEHRRDLAAQLRESRSYFDNAHDSMTDVWNFPRVVGEERFGHATPKPVAMVTRALKSSSAPGDLVAVPFGGTCPEIVAAEQTGRRCVIMEISPVYCDVIVRRWESFTGQRAVLEQREAA